MDSDTQWYAKVEGGKPLLQGSFVDGLPIVQPAFLSKEDGASEGAPSVEAFGYKVRVQAKRYDVVIMSQSCDLENEKLDFVLVCPHWSFETLEQKDAYFRSSEGRTALQQGSVPAYHLLPPCNLDTKTWGFRVVDFRAAQVVPYLFIRQFADEQSYRVQLNSPYREYLSQAYARFIMRVGLPQNLPHLPKYKKPGTES